MLNEWSGMVTDCHIATVQKTECHRFILCYLLNQGCNLSGNSWRYLELYSSYKYNSPLFGSETNGFLWDFYPLELPG